jgi:septin 3/9/12
MIGQTGLGKSTLINTLFASHLIESKGRTEPDISPRQTTEIHAQSHSESPRSYHGPELMDEQLILAIVENGVRLKMNIIDTPGYGDQINNDGCWEPIIKYVSCPSRQH